jgi:hypothetical protein
VIEALDEPDPIAGIGNYPKAYRILNALSKTDDLQITLLKLADRYYLEVLLSADMPVDVDQSRLRDAIRLVKNSCKCPSGIRRPTTLEHEDLHKAFPKLILRDYCISDSASTKYNCLAWTMGYTDRNIFGSDVLKEIPGKKNEDRNTTISDYDDFYKKKLGLSPTKSLSPNSKVALFAIGNDPQHVALLKFDCFNAESKLGGGPGAGPRILHELSELEGGVYGDIVRYYEKTEQKEKTETPKKKR